MPGHKLNKNKKEIVIKLRNTEPARWSAPLTDPTAVTVWKCFHLLRNLNTGQPDNLLNLFEVQSTNAFTCALLCSYTTQEGATSPQTPSTSSRRWTAYLCLFSLLTKNPFGLTDGFDFIFLKKTKNACLFLKRTVVYIMNSWLFKGDWAGHENLKFLLH